MNSMQALDPSSGKAISGLACDSGASNAGLTEAPPSGSGGIPIPIRRGIWLCFGGETAYDVATYFIATVLLAAAALKIQQLAQGDGPEMARQPGLFAVAVVGESAFGLWLLLASRPRGLVGLPRSSFSRSQSLPPSIMLMAILPAVASDASVRHPLRHLRLM